MTDPIRFSPDKDSKVRYVDVQLFREGPPMEGNVWMQFEDDKGNVLAYSQRMLASDLPNIPTRIRFVFDPPPLLEAGKWYDMRPCSTYEPVEK